MPALNWDIFTGLPGSVEKNFELLCRGIVRHRFGSYGSFRSLANQPGVEFHLKLDSRCDLLGDVGRWWGWQCKWYDLAADRALGATRRSKIAEGIEKAEEHVIGLTDFVLWTRRTLSKADQGWFTGLSSKMKLHLWTGDEVDNFLTCQAAVLRSTYFGELVLTPDILRERHEQAVAPIKARWRPDVHQVGDAERDLSRRLGEVASWGLIRALSSDLRRNAKAVEDAPPVPPPFASLVADVITSSRQTADTLDRVLTGIGSGDLDLLRDEVSARPRGLAVSVATAPRRLRAGNHRAGLYATNAVASCHDAVRVLGDVEDAYSSRLVAVLAPAGCGKTHIAAQLTVGTEKRPHGVLLHGRDLHATHTLDDLARRVLIAAQPVPSMESLLAAVDAAGQRARHRLPVFIDGLNESEDPRAWKPLLAELETTLAKYPYVLLVCTLRPEFVDDALPDETRRIEIQDYGEETIEAIDKHFRYWKIDRTDAALPEFLAHPLTLRLFCEVTNPTRQQLVGVSAMPGSLTKLFERYLEQVGVRIFQLSPRAHRYYPQDVNAAIAAVANQLWESRARSLERGELRKLLGDEQRPWDQSLVRALEHEGILLRMPSNGSDSFVPAYDMLGGHIIATALLARHGQSAFESWIREPSTTTLLAGDYDVRHPLAGDVLRSFVHQVPQRFHSKQLWQLVDEPLRGRALRLVMHLEPAFLDAVTIDAVLDLVRAGDAEALERLWHVRGMPAHPLNAEALDRVLRTMTVAERDLRWTEWLRRTYDDVLARSRSVRRDVEALDRRWRARSMRAGDRLRARWVLWTLTSTVRRLRDQATRALYWFGRVDPEGLFAVTLDSLTVNDAYVGERMLAVAYGVMMSYQREAPKFAAILRPFLEQLAAALVGATASVPTRHYLARVYVRGIVALAAKFHPATLPAALSGKWAFASPARVQPLTAGDAGFEEAGRTLHMDFENYTLGRLFHDRDNYDMNHAGHQAAAAHLRGVVWALGWRSASFDAIDNRIAEDAYRHLRRDQSPVERYGKKYGWIGFYTYAGLLDDRGMPPRETGDFSDVDIDPSFPEEPPVDGETSAAEGWLLPSVKNHEDWMRASATSLPLDVLRRDTICGHDGPWLAVHGNVSAGDSVLGRRAWAFISAMVVSRERETPLVSALKAGTRPWVAREVPSDYYVFAGEIPWHPSFASVALAESAYVETVRIGAETADVEVLAHGYAWESYHSEMNRAGGATVPSQPFSARFDLRSIAQSFDQVLPDGSRASITLGGVDGLEGDVVYVREDLLRLYNGDRSTVWFVSGERELRPYPPSPPAWLLELQRNHTNAWNMVITEDELKRATTEAKPVTTPKSKPTPKKAIPTAGTKPKAKTSAAKPKKVAKPVTTPKSKPTPKKAGTKPKAKTDAAKPKKVAKSVKMPKSKPAPKKAGTKPKAKTKTAKSSH